MYERAEPTVRNKVIVIKASGSGVKRTIKIGTNPLLGTELNIVIVENQN